MEIETYVRLDATDIARMVRAGEVSAAEVHAVAERRRAETDAEIGAVVEWYDDPSIPEAAEGLLAGVPFLRKDYGSAEAGRLVEMGSRLALGHRAMTTSELYRRLSREGAVVVGRTAVPELILHGSTESTAFGVTRNPFDPSLSSGGSSGGAGAAVAAGVVPAAHASDCAGSIRIPAAACGLVGLKPGRQRVRWENGGWGGIAEEFVLTRTVRDARLFLDVLGDGPYSHTESSLRIGVNSEHWAGYAEDPVVVGAVESVAGLLESVGHRVEPVPVPVDYDACMSTFPELFGRWMLFDVDLLAASTFRPVDDTTLEPVTLALVDACRQLTVSDVTAAQIRQGVVTAQLTASLADVDVLLTPTLGRPSIPLGTLAGDVEPLDRYFELNDEYFAYGYPFNLAGWPSLSVPAGATASGTPLGVQLSAAWGHEHTLLDLAAQIEETAPFPTALGPDELRREDRGRR